MSDLEIFQFPALSDNYCFLIHSRDTHETAVVDTPEVSAIERALEQKGWSLTHIFNTHHHFDHAGGNLELKQKWQAQIIGPRDEKEKIPGLDIAVGDGDMFSFGGKDVQVLGVPGHTLGHIAYYFPECHKAFVGDALFALGCGRVFEGTPTQMWASLRRLMELPDDTLVYCAHEYTLSNAKFALMVEPNNKDLKQRVEEIEKLREQGLPTVPTSIGLEKRTNPFLRPDSDEIRRTLNLNMEDDATVFAATRQLKDNF